MWFNDCMMFFFFVALYCCIFLLLRISCLSTMFFFSYVASVTNNTLEIGNRIFKWSHYETIGNLILRFRIWIKRFVHFSFVLYIYIYRVFIKELLPICMVLSSKKKSIKCKRICVLRFFFQLKFLRSYQAPSDIKTNK